MTSRSTNLVQIFGAEIQI